ncbi:kelch repeat-containing protein [Parabacteroides sp. Marseille-P3160]|uniref:kelch repeat-containing protein n=1 Tax=Parabacteroides sp. Marseille-P3160 TaxID=1917887 RepID=UPI0009BBD6FF|nr:kelch repeat-containing protein [Parabacteroides sp. Marseille-P3160]
MKNYFYKIFIHLKLKFPIESFIYFFFCLCFLISLMPVRVEAQGIKFNGNEKVIDERTSYSVFTGSSPIFKDILDISFDLSLPGPSDVGYIFRLKTPETPEIYNLFLNNAGDSIQFKFNIEGKQSLLTANLKRNKAKNHLLHVNLFFNLVENSLQMKINQFEYKTVGISLPAKVHPHLFFGRSDYFIDVPSIIIKNLVIKDHKTSHAFRFDENQGNLVHDTDGQVVGNVQNPVWLIDDSYYWKLIATSSSKTIAGANYNEERQSIYYFNKDSIFIFRIVSKEMQKKKYPSPCPLSLNLATNFISPRSNFLYAYEVMPNQSGGENMALLNLEDYTWEPFRCDSFSMQLHHHAIAMDTTAKKYYIFGGFGNQHYSNKLYEFNLVTGKWKELPLSGDVITPRYFSAMAYQPKDHSLSIFGGMGNESGEQSVGRRYYYDFYQIDLNTLKVTKKWEIPWKSDNIVPTRNLIIADESTFYTLCYPEHFSDSFLKLYQFSIQDGSFRIKGDSIPIHSEKIKTNACLYFNSRLEEFYAIVQEFADDDIASNVKIYSLNFPPVAFSELNKYQTSQDIGALIRQIGVIGGLIVGAALCFLLLIMYYAKRKREEHIQQGKQFADNNPEHSSLEIKANAIFLFGRFTVRNREGKDITYLFSPKIKQTFLILMQYSVEGGITSYELSQLLWPNKPENKVKNSRGVTISNLRKVLEELDGIKLIYEKGIFKLILDKNCYCDYCHFQEIKESAVPKSTFRDELLDIISRGKFLKDTNDPEIDKFKEIIEEALVPFLLIEMEESHQEGNFSVTIAFANAMLNIDPVNETAFEYLIQALQKTDAHNEAKRRYIQFIADYKQIMGEEYKKHS